MHSRKQIIISVDKLVGIVNLRDTYVSNFIHRFSPRRWFCFANSGSDRFGKLLRLLAII